jgi:hypothetical protein
MQRVGLVGVEGPQQTYSTTNSNSNSRRMGFFFKSLYYIISYVLVLIFSINYF